MGRTVAEEKKSEYYQFRVKPSLKQAVQGFMSNSDFRDLDEKEFLVVLIRAGLRLKIETAKCEGKALSWLASHDPRDDFEEKGKKALGAR